MRTLTRILFLVVVYLLAIPALVQGQAKPYEVIGEKPVNARACPQLDCAIIQIIQPGETVVVVDTVTGDKALGSNQWHKVEMNGAVMYVHSALVVETAGTDDELVEVDTSTWLRFDGRGYSLLLPGNWMNVEELLEDADIVAGLAENAGEDPDSYLQEVRKYLEDGEYEVVFWETGGTGWEMKVFRRDPDTRPARLILALLNAQYQAEGDVILDSDIVTFPAGETIVIHSRARTRKDVTPGVEWYEYHVLTDEAVYYVVFVSGHSFPEDVPSFFDAVLQSLRIGSTSGKPT